MSGKACGSCSLCCKAVAVHEIAKPGGDWCAHARPGRGCAIYETRPGACRRFMCAWLESAELDDAWKPQACGFVLHAEPAGRRLCVSVDPARPDAWRRPPFHDQIKAWSGEALRRGEHMVAYIGPRVIAIFPEEDLDLGPLAAGDALIAGYKIAGAQRTPKAVVVKADGARVEVVGGTYAHAG